MIYHVRCHPYNISKKYDRDDAPMQKMSLRNLNSDMISQNLEPKFIAKITTLAENNCRQLIQI